jgi:hypothetical protein
LLTGIPGFEHSTYLRNPRHVYGAARIQHNNGPGIYCGYRLYQGGFCPRQIQIRPIKTF